MKARRLHTTIAVRVNVRRLCFQQVRCNLTWKNLREGVKRKLAPGPGLIDRGGRSGRSTPTKYVFSIIASYILTTYMQPIETL